jgi:ABC-type lipoprotein export system ATPase subunit
MYVHSGSGDHRTAGRGLNLFGAEPAGRAGHHCGSLRTANIGILFQDGLLFPCLSAGSSLAFGLWPPKHRGARICAALTGIGIEGPETSDPATLSGGQKTRVALMRTNGGDHLDPAHRDFSWTKDQGR